MLSVHAKSKGETFVGCKQDSSIFEEKSRKGIIV